MNNKHSDLKIGAHIKEQRNNKGWSQKKLADKIGISDSLLSKYENNKKNPGLKTLAAIADALKISLDLLYYGDSTKAVFENTPDEGRLIVNSIYFLWKCGVISYWESGNEYNYSVGSIGRKNSYQLLIQKYPSEIKNLVKNLDEYESRKKTYPNPDEYLEILLESFANEINEITKQNDSNK